MSYNPEDRFSCDAAHLYIIFVGGLEKSSPSNLRSLLTNNMSQTVDVVTTSSVT